MSQMSPKRTKFRKQQKGKNRGVAWKGSDVSFGDFALQAVDHSHVTSRQIEAGRMAIQRHVKRSAIRQPSNDVADHRLSANRDCRLRSNLGQRKKPCSQPRREHHRMRQRRHGRCQPAANIMWSATSPRSSQNRRNSVRYESIR